MAELSAAAVIDAMISQPSPDTNYGANGTCELNIFYLGQTKTGWTRVVANFDVSAIPAGSVISSAKLVRYFNSTSPGGNDEKISRCKRPADWVEGEVTWNDYKLSAPWTNGGGDYDDASPGVLIAALPSGSGSHETAGLGPYVEDALANRGGVVSLHHRLAAEAPGASRYYIWRSSEFGSDEWRLVVDYEPPAAPSGHESRPRPSGRSGARPAQPAGGRRAANATRASRPATPHRTQTRR